MKNMLKVLLGVLAVLLVFSCDNDDDNGGTSPDGSMTATVDDVQWEADLAAATFLQNRLGLTGQASDGQTISLSLEMSTLSPITITVDQTSLSAVVYQEETGGQGFSSNGSEAAGGTVVITEVNTDEKWVSGTFESLCVRPLDGAEISIQNGTFNKVPYTEELPGSTNFLMAKIDNQDWSAINVTGSTTLGKIFINATDSEASETIGLTVPEDVETGSYDLSAFGTYTAQYNPNAQTFYSATSGTLSITEHNTTEKIIKGNFSFEAVENLGAGPGSASITEGNFSLTY